MGPLYLGFDLSTQQLKGLVTSQLNVLHVAKFDFDAESSGFTIKNGVITNQQEHEVYAPLALWLQALDSVLDKLKASGLDFAKIKAVSGAGQQHGSIYWSKEAESILSTLKPSSPLQQQMTQAFAHPYSPNWQDASTQQECDQFDVALGSEQNLAQATGSSAHHRFTGPQILRFHNKYPDAYSKTSRISLVSSFLASLFLGHIAPFDISDVCGMNLWDIKTGQWSDKLIALAAGGSGAEDLKKKLGAVVDGGMHLGTIANYFVQRYGFSEDCAVIPFTGDNPSTIIALPLRPLDAMVSLGTSTTFLMSTPAYKPDPSVHFFNHPTSSGLYMFMLCYKNGGLAREMVRDAIFAPSGWPDGTPSWEKFDEALLTTPPLAQPRGSSDMKMGLYFPRPEIVPNLPSGHWHYIYNPQSGSLQKDNTTLDAAENARLIVESQLLSIRLRSKELVSSPAKGLPPQPRRIYLVGGGSRNRAIAKLAGEVLGGSEGVFKLDVGENACALGGAYKAVWAMERDKGQSFEDFIGARWKEDEFVERIADGYHEGLFGTYGEALKGFEKLEKELLKRHKR